MAAAFNPRGRRACMRPAFPDLRSLQELASMRTTMVPQPPSHSETELTGSEEIPRTSRPEFTGKSHQVVSGLHCIDDMRARGWRLISMSNEGAGGEPIAVMVREP